MTVRQAEQMARDMEPRSQTAPDPYNGDMPSWYAAPVVTNRPEWTELRPLHNPDSLLEVVFSRIAIPVRALALSVLWSTKDPYRFFAICATLALIYVLWSSR